MTFEDKLGQWRLRIENYLQQYLQQQDSDCGNLAEAMRYGTLGGGKRLRAILVYATAETIGLPADDVDSIAAAIEMIHAYSLIHDDLPAMDDDDLRRGQPTTHIQYGDATAILAGDALQAEAFAVLVSATAIQNKPETIAALVQRLAFAAGQAGMVGGQQLDLDAEGQTVSLETLSRIHQLKTGALIRACCTMPALLAGLPASEIARLDDYAKNIGLAFQVHDDVLDITADTDTLGKPQGADLERGKATYPALMGLSEARAKAANLRDDACATLSGFGDKAHWLEKIADLMVSRSH